MGLYLISNLNARRIIGCARVKKIQQREAEQRIQDQHTAHLRDFALVHRNSESVIGGKVLISLNLQNRSSHLTQVHPSIMAQHPQNREPGGLYEPECAVFAECIGSFTLE